MVVNEKKQKEWFMEAMKLKMEKDSSTDALIEYVSEYACTTSTPLVQSYKWALEQNMGDREVLSSKLAVLKKYYGEV